MPLLHCPLCKKPISITEAQAGSKFSCPHCTQRIQAPGKPPPPPIAAMTHLPPPRPSWWTREKAIGIGIASAFALVAFVGCLIVFLTRPGSTSKGEEYLDVRAMLTDLEKSPEAPAKYIGKTYKVKGTVFHTNFSIHDGSGYLRLDERGTFTKKAILVGNVPGQAGKIQSLESGTEVVFSGRCHVATGSGAGFEDCKLLSP